MKHCAKIAVVFTCLLASAVASAFPSTPKTQFNSYTFETLDIGDKLADHNVANGGVPFTDLIRFELAPGSTYDIGFTATSNSNSAAKKFASFSFTLYSGALMTEDELLGATLVSGSPGSFERELSVNEELAGWYTLAVSGKAASNGAKYSLAVSTLTTHAAPSAAAPIAASVPEPATYAILLAGLGLMAFVSRRRDKV